MTHSQNFEDYVKDFDQLSPDQARTLLESGMKAVFVGRPSCPFCRRFVPKLHQVADEYGLIITYVNSEDSSTEPELSQFRKDYEVVTVPGLLIKRDGEVHVRCDSSMTVEEIATFLGK